MACTSTQNMDTDQRLDNNRAKEREVATPRAPGDVSETNEHVITEHR